MPQFSVLGHIIYNLDEDVESMVVMLVMQMTQRWKRELITSDDRIKTADDPNRLKCSAGKKKKKKPRDKYKVLCLRGGNNQ